MINKQTDMILAYLYEYGSITPMEAIEKLGCMRLAARISDLKKRGYNIISQRVTAKNRFGVTVGYKMYMLDDRGR